MKVITKIDLMRKFARESRSINNTIGFIPTMGALHSGHLSLIRKARKENNCVVVSIFVNPKQFNNAKDLLNYPQTLDHDKKLIQPYTDCLFTPRAKEIYPKNFQTLVSVKKYSQDLEGKYRPGHFEGMATIVLKLFNIINPTRAYFGLKDYQQYLIVSQMVKDLNINTAIIGAKTIREASKLAMSSRNARLTPEDKITASRVYKILSRAPELIVTGEKNPSKIQQKLSLDISSIPGVKLEYLEIRSRKLAKLEFINQDIVILTAFYVNGVRLIDNIIIEI